MMPDMIKDGQGKGFLAGVDTDNRLKVVAKTAAIQHVISGEKNQAYQCIGTATLENGTVVALHLRNSSSTKQIVVTYVRHQILDPAGGTSLPNANNYFRIALGRIYSADGATATPVNVFEGSGNSAEVTAYQSNPTLTRTANEIDRWYTKSEGDMNGFNKEGSLIIPPNGNMELSYVGDHTSGTIYTRISFLMEEV